jgi:two-component system nitrate/nitrite response regulator NarL
MTRRKSVGAAISKSRPCTACSGVTPSVRSLIRKIVAQSARPRKDSVINQHNSAEPGRVLMDVEIDGVRFFLCRSGKRSTTTVRLSPREREIVRMIAKGYPNKAIAGVLEISGWTVCTHLRRIFWKLGVTSRPAMVARVMELKLLEPDTLVGRPPNSSL